MPIWIVKMLVWLSFGLLRDWARGRMEKPKRLSK